MAEECIFCKIAGGEIAADILYRDDNCFVIRDIHPSAPVHLLIIPNRHFTYLIGLTPNARSMVGGLFAVVQEMATREGVDSTGYRLVINQRSDAGQDIAHLHLHLLGGRRLGRMG